MDDRTTTGDTLVEAAKSVVDQNLDTVEAGLDTAIDHTKDVVHDLRNDAVEAVDHALGRVKRSWDRQRQKIDQYLATHPWVLFGGLLLLAYLFSGAQRSRAKGVD